MVKKKYLVGLFILLLTLLLGLLSTSYAWSYNEVKGTIENVIVNSGYNNVNLTNLNSFIHTEQAEHWTELYNYDNFMIMSNAGAITDSPSILNHSITAYAWNNPKTDYNLYEYKYSSSVWGLKTTTGITRITFNGTYESEWKNDIYYHTSTSNNVTYWGFGNRNNPPIWVIFTNKTILANSIGGVATQNWNTFNQYQPMVWNFTANGSTVSMYNGNMSYYHTIDSIYNCPLGVLKDSIYARKITYAWGTWNGSKYTWGNDKVLYDYNRNGYLPNYFVGSTTEENYVYSTRIDINTNNHANDILALTIESDNSTSRGTIITFYLVSNNYTNIVGGVFYPGNTFSGDYGNQYNQQQQINDIIGKTEENTEEIKDTITDGSQVGNILDDTFSGDLAGSIGYQEIGKAYTLRFDTPIMTFIDAVINTLNEDTNVYWDYSMHGETPTRIYASDFTTPNGTLKTFLRLFMVFATLYVVYLHFKLIIEKINSGNAINVLHEADADMYFVKM